MMAKEVPYFVLSKLERYFAFDALALSAG